MKILEAAWSAGGKKAAKNMTPEQISARGAKAARARWDKAPLPHVCPGLVNWMPCPMKFRSAKELARHMKESHGYK